MFARILRFQTQPERVREASLLFEESVLPLCRKQKGYRGALYLVDHETGKNLPITLWESEKDMLETESNRFFQEQLVKFMNLYIEFPVREGYEVLVHDLK
jgi:hypothetical protein